MRLRADVGVGLVVAALVAGSVAAVVATGGWQPAELDPSTPEGVVQAYLQAVADHDVTAAADLLVSGSACDATDIENGWYGESLRAELADVTTGGDAAVVRVRIVEGGGAAVLGDEGWSHTERFELREERDGWRIADAPWPTYGCEQEW